MGFNSGFKGLILDCLEGWECESLRNLLKGCLVTLM